MEKYLKEMLCNEFQILDVSFASFSQQGEKKARLASQRRETFLNIYRSSRISNTTIWLLKSV